MARKGVLGKRGGQDFQFLLAKDIFCRPEIV